MALNNESWSVQKNLNLRQIATDLLGSNERLAVGSDISGTSSMTDNPVTGNGEREGGKAF